MSLMSSFMIFVNRVKVTYDFYPYPFSKTYEFQYIIGVTDQKLRASLLHLLRLS